MQLNDSFTVDQMLELLHRRGVETSLFVDDDEDSGTGGPSYECSLGEVEFMVMFLGDGPDFSLVALGAATVVSGEPLAFVNEINHGASMANAHVKLDDDGNLEVDEDGNYLILTQSVLHFHGGVSADHVEFLLEMWFEELHDFYGIEHGQVEDELSASDSLEISTEVKELSVLEQIQWVLQAEPSVQRTARELADFLMLDKHTINSVLYGNRGLFSHDGGQRPRWRFGT